MEQTWYKESLWTIFGKHDKFYERILWKIWVAWMCFGWLKLQGHLQGSQETQPVNCTPFDRDLVLNKFQV